MRKETLFISGHRIIISGGRGDGGKIWSAWETKVTALKTKKTGNWQEG
ncbi:MAG: hypothetical protein IPL53_09560 [Ignavibacteria bacterium]|nr:hypothetical protein [Ignavibacteria bacterium]